MENRPLPTFQQIENNSNKDSEQFKSINEQMLPILRDIHKKTGTEAENKILVNKISDEIKKTQFNSKGFEKLQQQVVDILKNMDKTDQDSLKDNALILERMTELVKVNKNNFNKDDFEGMIGILNKSQSTIQKVMDNNKNIVGVIPKSLDRMGDKLGIKFFNKLGEKLSSKDESKSFIGSSLKNLGKVAAGFGMMVDSPLIGMLANAAFDKTGEWFQSRKEKKNEEKKRKASLMKESILSSEDWDAKDYTVPKKIKRKSSTPMGEDIGFEIPEIPDFNEDDGLDYSGLGLEEDIGNLDDTLGELNSLIKGLPDGEIDDDFEHTYSDDEEESMNILNKIYDEIAGLRIDLTQPDVFAEQKAEEQARRDEEMISALKNIDGNNVELEEESSGLLSTLGGLFTGLFGANGKLMRGFGKVFGFIKESRFFKFLADTRLFKGLAKGLSKFGGLFKGLGKGISLFGKVLSPVTKLLKVFGKILLPLTVALSAFDFYKGFSKEGASKIVGKKEEDLTLTERIGAGSAKFTEGLTFGLIDAKTIWKKSEEMGESLYDGYVKTKSLFKGMFNTLSNTISKGVEIVKTGISSFFNGIKNIFESIVDSISNFVENSISKLTSILSSLFSSIKGAFSSLIPDWLKDDESKEITENAKPSRIVYLPGTDKTSDIERIEGKLTENQIEKQLSTALSEKNKENKKEISQKSEINQVTNINNNNTIFQPTDFSSNIDDMDYMLLQNRFTSLGG